MSLRGRMDKAGLMDHGGGHWAGHEWASRDYAMPVKCDCTACPVNKGGECSVPTAVLIGADAKCKTGVELMNRPKPKPRCRICGGLIEEKKIPGGTRWEHVGEQFNHSATV